MSRKLKQVNNGKIVAQEWGGLVPIADLRLHSENAREGDIGAIYQSIAAVKFYGALLVQRSTNTVIVGNHRLKAAHEHGIEALPVIWLDVDDQTARKILVGDNRHADLASWNQIGLAELLQSIQADTGTLLGSGFDDEALQNLLADLAQPNFEQPAQPTIDMARVKSGNLADLAPSEEERAALAGRKLLIEYSGGKDSTAAAIWARHYFPESQTELLFVDMGADFVGFGLYLHDAARQLGCPLKILRSQRTVLETILEQGKWPLPLHPYCHDCLHQPLDDYMRQHAPDEIVVLRGGRSSERAATAKKHTDRWLTVERMPGYRYFQPLYFSDKATSGKLLSDAGMTVWDGYSRGLQRTACRICPGQRTVSYAAIRANFRDVWQELLALEARLGPGCWSDKDNEMAGSFEENADRGQAAFEAGDATRMV